MYETDGESGVRAKAEAKQLWLPLTYPQLKSSRRPNSCYPGVAVLVRDTALSG